MWQGDWKGICFNDLKPLLCEKHKQFKPEYEKCEIWNIPDQMMLRFATFIRIHIMDPFLFGKPYSQELFTTWAKEAGLLPDEGVFQDGTVNTKSKDIIILVDSVITHSIAQLLQVCLYCKESEESTDEYKCAELLHCPHLEDAIKCISSHKTYNELRKCFKKYDEKMVAASFLIALMYRFDATQYSTPEEALCKLDKELSDTEGDMWRNTGNDEYKNRNFYQAVAAYTMALKTSRYSTILYSNRAQAYIKLGKYDEAELDGRRTVVLKPTWCKGYYKLGAALQSQERIHDAHIVADYGMKFCDNPDSCKEFCDLQLHKVKWEKECYEKYGCFGLSKNSPKFKKIKPATKIRECNNEINDVPELTDPSNSEDSDSENDQSEKEMKKLNEDEENISSGHSSIDNIKIDPENSHKRMETKSKTAPPVNDTNSIEEKQAKKEHFKKLLTQGSSAIIDGCGHAAVRHFQQALADYKSSPELYNLEDYDIVCLKYAFGSACIKSGTFEHLNKAINIFNEIIKEHKETRFPIAYYGLGLSYYKLNRFKEALLHLTTVFSIIKKGIHCTVYSWPGTVTAIEETKSGILQPSLEALISKCQCPPPPDAVCRYKECCLTPAIYYTDPDFKGFSYIQCQDRCCLQYHPSCWRALKDTLERTDKDFLDQQCLTPDCECIISHVESIGKDGTTEKCFDSDTNDKFKKHKQKKSKLEKKLELREMRKKKRQENQSTHSSISEGQDILEEEELEETKENEYISESKLEDQPICNEVKETNQPSNKIQIKEVLSNLSVDAKPFYGWKKDGNSTEFKASEPKASKQKERKKPKRSTLSLEEFCDGSYDFSLYNQYQKRLHRLQEDRRAVEEEGTHWSTFCETQMSRIPQLDPSRPFHIPEALREDPSALEAVLQSYEVGETEKNKAIKENIYSYMEDLLNFKGPLHLEDPYLLQEIASFPTEAQELISESGGFKDFMLKSMRFAVVGEQICIISDVVKAYALPSKQKYDAHSMNKLDDFDHIYDDDDDDEWEDITSSEMNNLQSPLNPHAAEYSPNKHANGNEVTPTKILKNPLFKPSSKDSNLFDVSGHNIMGTEEKAKFIREVAKDINSKEPLLSLLTKLRQPLLSYNEECNSMNTTDDNDSSTTDESQSSFFSVKSNEKIHETSPEIQKCSKIEEQLDDVSCNKDLAENRNFSKYNIILGCDSDSSLRTFKNLKTNAVSKDNLKICTYDGSSDKLNQMCNSEANFVISEKSKESCSFKSDYPFSYNYLPVLVSQLPKDKKSELLLQVLKLVTTGDDAVEIITHINNQLKPFSLILTTKKQSRCIQVGAAESDMISQGVMKEDDELHKAAETINILQEEKSSLEEQKKCLESKLESALDLATRLQNKLSVETAALQKEIEDAKLQFEEEKLEFKKKQSGWESDQKRWQQLQTKINEELKTYKQEIENIRDQLQKTEVLLEEVHKSQKAAEAELENERKAKSDIEMTLKNFLEDYKEKSAKIKKRAQTAELELLKLKKVETLQKIDNSIVGAEQKFNELQDGINKFGNNLPPMYKKLLTSFLLQLKEYVNQLTIIRCNVVLCISQYVTEVDNGRPLSKLPPLVIPSLPDFPSLTPLSLPPMSLLNSNPDQSTAAPQPLYTNPAQLHNFNGQLLSPNIMQMQNVDSAQLPNQTTAQLPNPNAIFSNFNSTQLSNLNSSLLTTLNSTQLHVNPKSTAFASAALPTSIFPFSVSEVNNKYSVASKTSSGPPGLETLHTSVNTSSSSELPIPSVLPVTSDESSNKPVPVFLPIELPSSANKSSLKTENVSEQNIPSSTAQPLTEHLCQQESSKIDIDLPISLAQCEDAGLTANTKCAMTEVKSFSNISSSSSLSSLHSVEYSKFQESKEISVKDSETICQSLQNNNELANAMGARPKTSAINHIDDLELESSMAGQRKNFEQVQKSSGPSKSSVCDSNNSETKSIELGYTLKSEEPSSTESVPKNKETEFLNVQHAQQCKPQNREKKNCYEKLLAKLQSRYPRYSQSELMHYVKEFRKQQNNKLSGLTLESIVNGVSSIISRGVKKEDSAIPTPKLRSRPTVLVNKSTVPPIPSKHIPSVKPATTGECPWAKTTPINSLPQWTGSGADKNCIICLEDMTSWNVYRTDCGHCFHSNCIRAWLNKNSTCPICRVYILLPDEFPALG